MEPECFRCVGVGQRVDVFVKLGHFLTFGDDVALVEAERRLEHLLAEPDFAERVQQTFVEVVCDTAAILDLAEHVTDADPVHALENFF